MKKTKISIIGSGISGISCAVLLQKLGFDVTIYSKDFVNESPLNSSFVSLFPAASIIPHNIKHDKLHELFTSSLTFFDRLYQQEFKGLKVHRHFELFSDKVEMPDYPKWMKNFKVLSGRDLTETIYHPSLSTKTGWEFECYFADWSIYFSHLINHFTESGGKFVLKTVSNEDIPTLDSEVVINCSEMGATAFTEEKVNPIIYRGHLLHIKKTPPLIDNFGKALSYNFTPSLEYYSSENGNLQDVYLYPRKDGWILGGSRQIGTLNKHGDFIGEKVIEPTISIGEDKIPQQIYCINKEILEASFGINLDNYPIRELKIGYRYMGNNKPGLRLESEERLNKLVVHNFGHGGAGVSVSWGCALEVAKYVTSKHYGFELEINELVDRFKF